MFRTPHVGALALAVAASAASAQTIGPDLIVGDVDTVLRWGSSNGIVAYSVGAVICNQGDDIASWVRATPAHPVIAGNLYRLAGGRFEQIGVSWVKHTMFADVASLCGSCIMPPGYNGTQLGVGCSDAYSAAFNGELFTLGPRSQINGQTGVFPFPVDFTGFPAAAPTVGRRIQTPEAAVNPALNPGARYFAEVQLVAADENAYGNGADSLGYREFTVGGGTFNWTPAPASQTQRALPAILAWSAADPQVRVERVDIPGEGTIYVASRASETAPGVWRYVYAVQNITSDRAVGGFTLGLSPCASVGSTACVLPQYHSGEPWSNEAWPFAREGSAAGWSTPAPFATDPASSALRWGTLASFELVTDKPPRIGQVSVGLFKPGSPASVSAPGWAPGGSSDFNGDGFLDFFDYDDFVGSFEQGDPAADINGDGFLDFFDYDDFVSAFEAGC